MGRYPVWTCRHPISLILRTRFSLILGTRFEILGTRIGSLKHLKKPCLYSKSFVLNSITQMLLGSAANELMKCSE